MYKLKNNECILSINTTGINRNINHIFLINILSNHQSYHFYSTSNDTEKNILLDAIEVLKNKFIITYNGSHFDIEFLNKKIYEYGIKLHLENGLDIYQQLKNYYIFHNEKLTLSSLSKNFLNKSYLDQLQLIKSYKENPFDKEYFIDAGKSALDTRLQLYRIYYQTLEQKSVKITTEEMSYRLSLYNFVETKNQLILKYINLDGLLITYDNEFFSIRSTYEYIFITFPLHQGRSENHKLVKYIYAPYETSYQEDILPLIESNIVNRSVVEALSKKVIMTITI